MPALAHLELHRMEHAAEAARSADSKQTTDGHEPSAAAVRESFASRRLPCRSVALQRYLLKCCQVKNGGLRDKPGQWRLGGEFVVLSCLRLLAFVATESEA